MSTIRVPARLVLVRAFLLAHRSCCFAVCSLFFGSGERDRASSIVSSYEGTDPILITSSKPKYLLKVSSTNTIILAIRTSTCTFFGG